MGVTKKKYENVLIGTEELEGYGKGPKAFQAFLSSIDVPREIAAAQRESRDKRKTVRDAAVKKLRALRGLANRKVDPSSLMLQQIPIIPPTMRPVSVLADGGTPLVDGMNLLYADMIESDKALRSVSRFSDDVHNERKALYQSVEAAVGLREPVDAELRQRSVTGLLARIIGKGGPKTSYIQRKLLSGTVDAVSRGVVIPSTKLSIDEIGVPESQAWSMFRMPTIRAMRRRGIPLAKAMQEVDGKTKRAREFMVSEMEKRPVVATRAPVLHKYGIMAFKPKLMKGETLVMNPLVHAGFNLDHDGDTMNFHAVIGDKAAKEAMEKMLPTSNLIADKDLRTAMHMPRQDHALGLYEASTRVDSKKKERVFATKADVRKAFQRGEISIDTPVRVLNA
jgi:DNA-directed RNA polymerase subunit beta'